jgi:hypothetical protein
MYILNTKVVSVREKQGKDGQCVSKEKLSVFSRSFVTRRMNPLFGTIITAHNVMLLN